MTISLYLYGYDIYLHECIHIHIFVHIYIYNSVDASVAAGSSAAGPSGAAWRCSGRWLQALASHTKMSIEHVHVYIYIHTCVYMYIYIIYICIHMYICMWIHIYLHIKCRCKHTHITHTPACMLVSWLLTQRSALPPTAVPWRWPLPRRWPPGMLGSDIAVDPLYPEGPSTQYLMPLVPKTIPLMVFGIKIIEYCLLGPSGPSFNSHNSRRCKPTCSGRSRWYRSFCQA